MPIVYRRPPVRCQSHTCMTGRYKYIASESDQNMGRIRVCIFVDVIENERGGTVFKRSCYQFSAATYSYVCSIDLGVASVTI